MCGICAYVGSSAADHVVAALRKLEIRGYDSAGIAVWSNNAIEVRKGTGYVSDVFRDSLPACQMAIGHVRWATHGEVCFKNAHPHFDCAHRVAICHNGVIENADSLRRHLSDSHTFISDTDSEILAHIMEGKDIVAGMIDASEAIYGYNSFVAMAEGRIVVYCGGPPINVALGELASDAFALNDKRFLPLKVGDVVELAADQIIFHKGIFPQWQLRHSPNQYNNIGQESDRSTHFEREIFSQPDAMLRALNNTPEVVDVICKTISKSVVLTGAGSSKVACMWAKFPLMRAGKQVEVIPVGEWQHYTVPEDCLVIAVSQSGETGTLVSLVEDLHLKSQKLAAIVNIPWSFLALNANWFLEMLCGAELSVIASKSFISECVILGQIASILSGQADSYASLVVEMSNALREWLPKLDREVDALDLSFNNCFVCGEGEFYPIAHEGAMKLKEGAYVFAEPMVSSEIKHEALPLVVDGQIVIWVGDSGGGGATIAQLRARGGRVIGIAEHDIGFDVHIQLPHGANKFPPLAVVPIQLITARIARIKGIDVDRPRNLAKAVTVR